jgi:hypothetical protein
MVGKTVQKLRAHECVRHPASGKLSCRTYTIRGPFTEDFMSKVLMAFCAAATLSALLLPTEVRAQGGNPCAIGGCSVVFDWGNGGSSPDVDRRYGAPSDLESSFLSGLTSAGFRITSTGQPSAMTITMRISPQNKALCDTMPGVNPDYTCHTVQRASVLFTANDSTVKQLQRIEVNPRCSDPKVFPTFTQFGRFAAETLIFQLVNDGKGQHPAIKCR